MRIYVATADAIKLAKLASSSNSLDNPLSHAIETYYSSYSNNRYANYLDDMEGATSLQDIKDKVYELMNKGFIWDSNPITVISLLCKQKITDEMNRACCDSFAEYIYRQNEITRYCYFA